MDVRGGSVAHMPACCAKQRVDVFPGLLFRLGNHGVSFAYEPDSRMIGRPFGIGRKVKGIGLTGLPRCAHSDGKP
jgi:hypothetical protein